MELDPIVRISPQALSENYEATNAEEFLENALLAYAQCEKIPSIRYHSEYDVVGQQSYIY